MATLKRADHPSCFTKGFKPYLLYRYVLLLILPCFYLNTWAQQNFTEKTPGISNDPYAKFIRFSTSDGLSSNEVLDILQDHTGIIWIATKNGLNRLIGNEITSYLSSSDTTTISDDLVTCLAEDIYGNIWAGTASGLNMYDRRTGKFRRFLPSGKDKNHLSDKYIRAIMADTLGNLWIETGESVLNKIKIKSLKFEKFPHFKALVEGDYFYFSLEQGPRGEIYIGGRNYPTQIFYQDEKKFASMVWEYGDAIVLKNKQGHLFMASRRNVYICNSMGPDSLVWQAPYDIRAACCGSDGSFWVGGSGYGLYRSDPQSGQITHYENANDNAFSLCSDHIFKLYRDKQGNIWIGTDHGLAAYMPDMNVFRHYRHLDSDASSLHSNEVTALLQDKDGRIWVGTDGEGVDTFSLDTEKFGNIKYHLLTKNISRDVFEREKDILKQYVREGAISLSPGSWPAYEKYRSRFEGAKALNEDKVSALYADSEGKIWIGLWAHCGFNEYDPANGQLKRYALFDDSVECNTMWDLWGANWYNDFLEDSKGRFWIATWEGMGLNLFDRKKGKFLRQSFLSFDYPMRKRIEVLFNDGQQRMWIGGENYFGFIDLKTGRFSSFLSLSKDCNSLSGGKGTLMPGVQLLDIPYLNCIWDFARTKDNVLWACSSNGLVKIDLNNLEVRCFQFVPGVFEPDVKNEVYDIALADDSLAFWLTSWSGLFYFDGDKFIRYDINGDKGPKDHPYKIVKDGYGSLWIAAGNSLLRIDTKDKKENIYSYKNSILPDACIRSLKQEEDSLVIGTDGGLFVYRFKEDSIVPFSYCSFNNSDLSGIGITAVERDNKNRLWIGTINGINIIDPSDKSLKVLKKDDNKENSLPDNMIVSFTPSDSGMWVATVKGYCFYQPGKDSFYLYNGFSHRGLSNRLTSRLLEDSKGYLWIGTTEKGVNRMDPASGEIEHYFEKDWDNGSLAGNNVESIFEDHEGSIWIGTEKGLSLWLPEQKAFKRFDRGSGLPSSHIKSVLEDNSGRLWISTLNGLSRMDKKSGLFLNFFSSNKIQSNEYSNAHAKLSSGELAFGGSPGFIVFDPDSLKPEREFPSLVFTRLAINDSLYFEDATEAGQIQLAYDQNTISLNFSAAGAMRPDGIRYRYRLAGIESSWQETGAAKKGVKYSHLEPGIYVFECSSTNDFGIWNPKAQSLEINIAAPWWLKAWFRIAATFIFIAVIYIIFRLRIMALKRSEARLKKQVAEKTEELSLSLGRLQESEKQLLEINRTKDKFFSIISHDLKNPVYALQQASGILYKNFSKMDDERKEELIKSLHSSIGNTERLLSNLLLWSVSQKGGISFRPQELSLYELCRQVLETQQMSASAKGISLINDVDKDKAVFADRNMLSTILHNLVSNAIKFTPAGGRVLIRAKAEEVFMVVSVEDSGKGIPEEKLEKLFRPGEKIRTRGTNQEEGTGLGLILCREFVEKHGGKIWVDSTGSQGSVFSFSLPLSHQIIDDGKD